MAKRRMNHEGSIFQRKDGSWRAQVTVEGKRLSYSGKTQRECLEWVRNTNNQVERGLTYEGSKIVLADFLSDWLISKKSSITQKTLEQYRRDVEFHVAPLLGRVRVSELKAYQIQKLYDTKVAEGLGLRTVMHIHSTFRHALNHAVRLGILPANPALATNPPKPGKRSIKILDESQVQRLLITANMSQPRNYALYFLAVTTGIRQGELLGLKWGDVDWESKTVYVRRQVQWVKGKGLVFRPLKTRSSERLIQLGKDTLQVLREHRQNQAKESLQADIKWVENDLLFPSGIGTPWYATKLHKSFRKLIKEAGLPHIRFHDLRHTAASLMLKHGISVMVVSKRLGHAQPSITLDVYGHLIPGMQEDAARIMDDVVTPILVQIAPKLHQENEPSK